MNQNTNTDLALLLTLVLLLVFSAFDLTSQPAFYVGLFLLVIAWWSAWQTGNLQSFGQEFIKPMTGSP